MADTDKSQYFLYDNMDRLEQAIGDYGTRDFQNDLTGNRELLTVDGVDADFHYDDPASHHLSRITSGVTTYSYDYDEIGNTTLRFGVEHHYSPKGRRVVMGSAAAPTTVYLYNALGQRINKLSNTAAIQYFYDLDGQLIAELNLFDELDNGVRS